MTKGGSVKRQDPSQRARRGRLAARRAARASRVLVCDCDPTSKRPMSDDVMELGYEVVAHHTLADGLREATVTPFDVVLVSVPRLPDAKQKLLQLLRRATPHIPLVVVTSDDSLEMRVSCQAVQPFYYAVRPVPIAELREALNGALARSPARG